MQNASPPQLTCGAPIVQEVAYIGMLVQRNDDCHYDHSLSPVIIVQY